MSDDILKQIEKTVSEIAALSLPSTFNSPLSFERRGTCVVMTCRILNGDLILCHGHPAPNTEAALDDLAGLFGENGFTEISAVKTVRMLDPTVPLDEIIEKTKSRDRPCDDMHTLNEFVTEGVEIAVHFPISAITADQLNALHQKIIIDKGNTILSPAMREIFRLTENLPENLGDEARTRILKKCGLEALPGLTSK